VPDILRTPAAPFGNDRALLQACDADWPYPTFHSPSMNNMSAAPPAFNEFMLRHFPSLNSLFLRSSSYVQPPPARCFADPSPTGRIIVERKLFERRCCSSYQDLRRLKRGGFLAESSVLKSSNYWWLFPPLINSLALECSPRREGSP